MKKVVELDHYKMIDPSLEKECSVCHLYKPKTEFLLPTPRTNCDDCYRNPLMNTPEFRAEISEQYEKGEPLRAQLRKEEYVESLKDVSISVEDMIEALKALPKGSRLVVTEDGYYSSSSVASIFLPVQFEDHETMFVVGHSSENC